MDSPISNFNIYTHLNFHQFTSNSLVVICSYVNFCHFGSVINYVSVNHFQLYYVDYAYVVLSELKINPSVEFLNSFLLQDHGR